MHNHISLPDGLGLRLAHPSDNYFIANLFRASHEFFWLANAEADYIETVIEHQQTLQAQGYGNQTPNAFTFIIEKQGTRIGRIVMDFGANVAHLVDIMLIPQTRAKGYGQAIIQALQQTAQQQHVPMSLYVEQNNFAAQRLYQRLGFRVDQSTETHHYMVWYPPASRVQV